MSEPSFRSWSNDGRVHIVLLACCILVFLLCYHCGVACLHDFFLVEVVCIFAWDRFQTLVEYHSRAAKGNGVLGFMCGGDASPCIICIDRRIVCNTGVADFVIGFAQSIPSFPVACRLIG